MKDKIMLDVVKELGTDPIQLSHFLCKLATFIALHKGTNQFRLKAESDRVRINRKRYDVEFSFKEHRRWF